MAHPEEPTLPEDTGQRKNKNYTRYTTKLCSTMLRRKYCMILTPPTGMEIKFS